MNKTSTIPHVTGVVLAGGLALRMGGADKGLQDLSGRPMVAWVLDRLAPQVDELLISANRNGERYAAFGYRVLPDRIAGFAGPLAALHAALHDATSPLLVTVPCDAPFLPRNLVSRLHAALVRAEAAVAVASTGGRRQPVFLLCKREVQPHLRAFLAQGGRKIDSWYATLKRVDEPFDDQLDAFVNVNSDADLSQAAERIRVQTTVA